MRSISQSYLDLLTNVRRIGARMTIRDERLVFEPFSSGETNRPTLYHESVIDSAVIPDNGLLRVARNSSGYLCYQHIPTPETTPWPVWVVTGYQLDDCRPGVLPVAGGAYIYVLQSFGGSDRFARYYYNASAQTLSVAQQLWDGPSSHQGVAIAPVALDEFFAQYFPYTGTRSTNYALINYYDSSGNTETFPGAVYGDLDDSYRFDAEILNGVYYIFTSDNEYGRPAVFKMLKNSVVGWSDAAYILPLDVLDDTSFLKLGSATVINDQIWVTGRLKRGSDIEMEMYMHGIGNFSIGRDMFVGNSDDFPDTQPGKLLLYGGYVYFLGWGKYAKAPATNLVGYDNKDLRLTTREFSQFTLRTRPSSSNSLTFYPKSDLQHAALKGNGQVTLDVGLEDSNGAWSWEQMGVFGIDGIASDYFDSGNEQQVLARGSAIKKLSQWTSDAFYDYWSQAKLAADPAALAEVVRISGLWSTDEDMSEAPIRLDRLNDLGILYTTAKASRNGQMSARFYNPQNALPPHRMTGKYGVGTNFYKESRGQAAERLGKESEDVTDSEFGNNGLFAMIGPEEHSGSDGIAIYMVKDSTWYKVSSVSYTAPKNSWTWVSLRFNEGRARVAVMEDSDWVIKIDERIDTEYDSGSYSEPWFREQRGRGAVAILNISTNAQTPGFTSTSNVIPVDGVSQFPTSETVIVDSEIIDYSGKVTAADQVILNAAEWEFGEGLTYSRSEHENDEWQDIKLFDIPYVSGNAGQITVGEDDGECILIIQAFHGPYGRQRIDKVKTWVKRVGNPTLPLYAFIVSDDFDNEGRTIAGPGRWNTPIVPMASAPVASQLISSQDFQAVEFNFDNMPEEYRWLNYNYERSFFVCITNLTPQWVSPEFGFDYARNFSQFDDASNYYILKLDNTVSASTGVLVIFNQDGWRKAESHFGGQDSMMPFEIYGIGNEGEGYEIYLDGVGDYPVGKDYFDGMALVATDGPGNGTVFEITDYDWQAPSQWVPTRTYLPPDNIEDHVGDPEHGYWSVDDLSRVFVDRNPYGAFSEGTTFKVYPALTVSQRGAQDTTATAHGPGTVSIYSDLSVSIDEVRFFSGEPDMRLEDMARELCAKAGVIDFGAAKDYDDTYAFSSSGDLDVMWISPERRNGIVQWTFTPITDQGSVGVVWRADEDDLSIADQYYRMEIHNDSGNYYARFGMKESDEDYVQMESYPIDDPVGTVTMSMQEKFGGIWVNDSHVFSFANDQLTTGENMGMYVQDDTLSIDIDWSKIDIRVDNFVLDLGYRGAQLLSSLIGPKKIIFVDTQSGGIYLDRTALTGSAAYSLNDLAVESARTVIDNQLINRARAEGAEIAEVVDWEGLREDGNLFLLVNATEANDEWETANESRYILNDSKSASEVYSVVGAADPRIEPNDIVRVRTAEGNRDLLVQRVAFRLGQNKDEALFDMSIEGRDAV
jgi:hypothetical protein